ncbi:hypothetical protein, partial [Neisseria sp.]|uniref:hypothetical protein n=1 Tax=Neisseria sp. TaxID=192066 RepID=UPI0035A0112C
LGIGCELRMWIGCFRCVSINKFICYKTSYGKGRLKKFSDGLKYAYCLTGNPFGLQPYNGICGFGSDTAG